MTFGTQDLWTGDMIAKISSLWADGLSANKIGKAMGITKNAVIGKVHRLGLPLRPNQIGSRDTRISEDRVDAILAMARAGKKSNYLIARDVGANLATVNLILKKHGIDNRPANLSAPTLAGLPSCAHNANPPPSDDDRQLVMRLLIEGRANRKVAAEVGMKVDEVRKIRLTIDVPKRERKLSVQRDRTGITWKTQEGGRPFQHVRRSYFGPLPTPDDIASFIAARGVTKCPAAALSFTTATIPDADRAALAAYREVKDEEARIVGYAAAKRGADAANRARGIG